MSEKRLSETMSDTTYAVCQAQETLNDAITKAINTHFEAGIQFAEERIIKLLEKHTHPEAEAEYLIDCDLCGRYYGVGLALALIKGEQK